MKEADFSKMYVCIKLCNVSFQNAIFEILDTTKNKTYLLVGNTNFLVKWNTMSNDMDTATTQKP
jgi:hypothetical protein